MAFVPPCAQGSCAKQPSLRSAQPCACSVVKFWTCCFWRSLLNASIVRRTLVNRHLDEELLVISIAVKGDANTVELRHGDELAKFVAHYEQFDEIRLLQTGKLGRWLMDRGKYPWAAIVIARLVRQNMSGHLDFPIRIRMADATHE